jgi:hypothetical protein
MPREDLRNTHVFFLSSVCSSQQYMVLSRTFFQRQ